MKEQLHSTQDVMIIFNRNKCFFGNVLEWQQTNGKVQSRIKVTRGNIQQGEIEMDVVLRHYILQYDNRTIFFGNGGEKK